MGTFAFENPTFYCFSMLTFIQPATTEQIDVAREIFREYEKWLGLDLCFQSFEAEITDLPGEYVLPDGRLYLVYADEKLAGCVALRKLDADICEMKRLFVRDRFRGQKIGVALIKQVIDDAREIGYKYLRLDTFPAKMGKAVSLYEAHGFRQIDPYYDNPFAGVLFMELSL